jgi:hypothetical protein
MNKRIQAQPVVSPISLVAFPARNRSDRSAAPEPRKPVESGLLRLCQEIAGSLLRRRLECGDPVRAIREMRAELVRILPECDETRAGCLIDLALELLHVKARGQFKRNALELSELIARAGNQLRDAADN